MVKNMWNNQNSEIVVKFVPTPSRCLNQPPQRIKRIMCRLPIRLLEHPIKRYLMNLLIISSLELGIDLFYLIHTKWTLFIQFFKHTLILNLIIFSLFLNVFELIRLAEVIPCHVRVKLVQINRVKTVSELSQQNDIIFY